MQALLESVASTLSTDPDLAGLALAWLALAVWGTAVVILAYCSRLRERAAMEHPPRHPLFPNFRGRKELRSKS